MTLREYSKITHIYKNVIFTYLTSVLDNLNNKNLCHSLWLFFIAAYKLAYVEPQIEVVINAALDAEDLQTHTISMQNCRSTYTLKFTLKALI